MVMQLEAVIFDMDGLMIDTEKTYREGWVIGAEAIGVELPDGFITNAAGRSIEDNIKELSQHTEDLDIVQKIRKVREDYFYKRLEEGGIPLKPFLPDLIQLLRKNQIKTAVATSSYKRRVEHIFEHYQMDPWFDAVITGDEVSKVKPDPELYLTALEMLGTDKSKTMILEDSLVGATAANNAEIPFIVVPDSSSENKASFPAEFINHLTTFTTLKDVADWMKEREIIKTL